MREYSWTQIREDAIASWGSVPQGQLEADILEAFQHQPALVVATIARVTAKFEAGKVNSPWAILRLELQKASSQGLSLVVSDEQERDRAVQRAEQWIRSAGIMFDRWDEVADELFGDRGRLRPWRSDELLVDRLEALWRELRPRGEQVEADELERAGRWKAAKASEAAKDPPDTSSELAASRARAARVAEKPWVAT